MEEKRSPFDQLLDAFILSADSPECEVYFSTCTGEIYLVSDYVDEDLPEDLHDNPEYVRLPAKRELDLGTALVMEFVRRHMPEHHEEVSRIFSRRGAYHRYKCFLDEHRMLERWHAFEADAQEQALRDWLASNQITIPTGEDTSPG